MKSVFDTAIGRVAVFWSESGVTRVRIGVSEKPCRPPEGSPGFALNAVAEMTAHLRGQNRDMRGIPLDYSGVTEFRKRVYETLRNNVGPGMVITYGQLGALSCNYGDFVSHGSARAVGGAMKSNPFPIIVPCHRVVAANGIGGYSGGSGVETKKILLRMERNEY